jgi:hypothetical protein
VDTNGPTRKRAASSASNSNHDRSNNGAGGLSDSGIERGHSTINVSGLNSDSQVSIFFQLKSGLDLF